MELLVENNLRLLSVHTIYPHSNYLHTGHQFIPWTKADATMVVPIRKSSQGAPTYAHYHKQVLAVISTNEYQIEPLGRIY
jgi:hypothetical protein